MRWQQQARVGFAIFTVVFAVVVYRATSSRPPAAAVPAAPRSDPSAVIESTGAVVTQAKGADEDFRVAADRQLGYADGSSRLEGATITIANRGGRSFIVTGREADVGPNRVSLVVRGNVRLVADDGLTVETEEAAFHEEDGLLRIPGKVRFERGRMSGSGLGATYDRNRDILWLLDDAVVDIAGEADGSGGTAITSNSAAMDRASGHVRFEGDVRIDRDAQVIETEVADARLTSDQERIELVELRGRSSVVAREGSAATLQAMRARDIDLTYGADGQVLESALLQGSGSIEVAGAGGASRFVSADRLDVGLEPDGITLRWLLGERDVVLEFMPTDAVSGRRIAAQTMEGRGEPGVGLTSLALEGGVEQIERSSDGAGRRRVTARTLTLEVAPGLGDVSLAEFDGDVQFEHGETTGAASHAAYDVAQGTLDLAPAETATPTTVSADGRRPVVRDARVVVEADQINLKTQGEGLVATGSVKSVMQPIRSDVSGATTTGGDPTRPSVLDERIPTYVAGQALNYDQVAGKATYTGEARLWQGETTIQGDTLTIDDETGNLKAEGAARSLLVLKNADDTVTEPSGPSLATASWFVYEESERRVTYHGRATAPGAAESPGPTTAPAARSSPVAGMAAPGPGASAPVEETWVLAHVTGPQGDLSARRIEMYLGADGSTVERVEAYGDVRLKTVFRGARATSSADGRIGTPSEPRDATGDRLTYYGADARYVMQGEPVTIIEKCRETLGKSLTFYTGVDTITVDGNEEIRTQTTAGTDCAEPPSE